jgi:membrane protease subunit HflC
MKKYLKWVIAGVVLVAALVLGNQCFFVLNEGENAVVQRFGRIQALYVKEYTAELDAQVKADNVDDGVNVSVYAGTGLYVKTPFIDTVIKYSSKLISYETAAREVTTADKRKLFFQNNAQWRIENPYRFYKAYNDVARAKMRIDDILYSRMNAKVGATQSHVLITDKQVSGDMLIALSREVSAECEAFGIRVADIRIKRTDLPEQNYESIYNRMNTERYRIAAQYRSEGEEESMKVKSETDREVISITSEAARDAEQIKGQADAEAAAIYNEAYGKNPEFFKFYNMLETYRQTVGSSSTLVIPLDSEFAEYLLGTQAEEAAPPPDNSEQITDNNEQTATNDE